MISRFAPFRRCAVRVLFSGVERGSWSATTRQRRRTRRRRISSRPATPQRARTTIPVPSLKLQGPSLQLRQENVKSTSAGYIACASRAGRLETRAASGGLRRRDDRYVGQVNGLPADPSTGADSIAFATRSARLLKFEENLLVDVAEKSANATRRSRNSSDFWGVRNLRYGVPGIGACASDQAAVDAPIR